MFGSTSPFGGSTTNQGLFGSTQQQPSSATSGGIFGSTPQNQQTGSALGTGLFGQPQQQPQQQQGGLFGSTATPGGGLFGQPQQQQTTGGFFGSTPASNTAAAGASGGGLFGSGIGFGQPQQQPQQQQQAGGGLFGSSTGFGQQQQQPSAGGGLFGSSTGFAQPQQQQTGGIFGNAAATTTAGGGGGLFGSSTGTFGQPQQQQTGGLFGSNTNAVSTGLFRQPQQSTGLFGSTASTQAGGGGIFGASNSTNALGQSAAPFGVAASGQQQQQQEPFKPLRVEDGSAGTEGLFGSAAATQAATGSGFGGGGLFGSTSTLQQQQQPAATGGLFGSTAPATGAVSAFGGGGGLFGSTGTQQVQQQGQQQQTGGGLFGSSTTAAPTTGGGLFGSSTGALGGAGGGLFGKPATGTGFGGINSGTGGGLFGGASTANSGGSGLFGTSGSNTGTLGGGLFGQQQSQQQSQQQAQQQGGLFGALGSGTAGAAATGQTGAGGGGLFGSNTQQQQQQSGLLGGGSSLFGAKPAAGAAGSTPSAGGGAGLFGSSSGNTSTTTFGGAGGGLFGSIRPAGSTPGSGALGAPATGGGLFGSATAGTASANSNTPGGGLFGGLSKTTGSTGGGGLFGSGGTTNTGGGLFGGSSMSLQTQQPQSGLFGLGGLGTGQQQQQQQQQQQLLGGGGTPSGGNLFALGGLLGAPQVTVQIVLSATNTTASQLSCQPISSVGESFSLGGGPPPQLGRRWSRRFLSGGTARGALPVPLAQSASGLGASFSLPSQLLRPQQEILQLVDSQAADAGSRNGWLAQTIHRSLAAVQQQQRKSQSLLPLSLKDYALLHRLQRETGGTHATLKDKEKEGASRLEDVEEEEEETPQRFDEEQQQKARQHTAQQREGDMLMSAVAAAAAAAAAKAASAAAQAGAGSSSGSGRISARGDGQNIPCRASLELRPILTSPEYECSPSIASLQQMSEEELRRVRDFHIRRPGFGSILFPGHTDLRGINLDLVVHIGYLEVSVYADAAPPVGVGLNKTAQVTLCNCKPKRVSKEAGGFDMAAAGNDGAEAEEEAAAAARNEQFVEKVKKYTEKMGATFLSLDTHTWEWRFEVEHFSVYKWIDEDAAVEAEGAVAAEAAEATQVAAFAAAAPDALPPKELALHLHRARILRSAPQALLLSAVAQHQHQETHNKAAEANCAAANLAALASVANAEGKHASASGGANLPATPRPWLRRPPFPVRCAPSFGPGGLCALPFFRSPRAPAAAGTAASESRGAYEVAVVQLSPLLPPAQAPKGYVWPQPFAKEAAEAIAAARAEKSSRSDDNCVDSLATTGGAVWTAGEVPRVREVQEADALQAAVDVETAAREYIANCSCCGNSGCPKGCSGKPKTIEEEGVRVVWDLKEDVRLHLFDSGVSVHRGLAAGAAAAAVGVVFEALRESDDHISTQTEELLLLRMLKFMQQQNGCYSGSSEGGMWPPASPWIPPSAAVGESCCPPAGASEAVDSAATIDCAGLAPTGRAALAAEFLAESNLSHLDAAAAAPEAAAAAEPYAVSLGAFYPHLALAVAAHLQQPLGCQAAFLYLDGYRHAAASPEGFLSSATGQPAWQALQRRFPVQQEQQELLLAAADSLLKALPSFLQGLLLVLQQRQQQILLHGSSFATCGVAVRRSSQKALHQQHEWDSTAAGVSSSLLGPEEQMDLLSESIDLCCSQQLLPQQHKKLQCCSACIQWMRQQFPPPSPGKDPLKSNEGLGTQQQQLLQHQLAALLQQRTNSTDAERQCWACIQSALLEAREQRCQ
ncbi:nucleoporin NUP145 [Cyclospora cayetanensis]|uniref:Nucleoporin NUP145 n=1 Tax=Cyclospora cayetanensis TaxID=88456 RepID=A0A6P6S1V1_9EIME|nr:nucleoporin NUP145 [Cyclospora cayetanensis]